MSAATGRSLTSGLWNERLGWLLLVVGFCAAVALDPWSLSERDAAAVTGSRRMAARHAQAVVLAMGFLQVAAALLLRQEKLPPRPRRFAALVLMAGTLIYALGYASFVLWPHHDWLIFCGAVGNLLGFGVLAWASWRAAVAVEIRVVLAVFVLGMTIDAICGLYAADLLRWQLLDLGPEDDVRQRMLRLARVAATALSLLTLLYHHLAAVERNRSGDRWIRPLLLIGNVGMPVVLACASFVNVDLKYLLPIPALAMVRAVVLLLMRASRTVPPLEKWGWLLIGVSMSIGLLVGMYAFDGPLPVPAFVGGYNELTRRLMRLGHAYAIVLGLLAILLSRQSAGRSATILLLAGTGVTLLDITLLMFWPGVPGILAPGPALVALSLAAGFRWQPPCHFARDTWSQTEPGKERNRLI